MPYFLYNHQTSSLSQLDLEIIRHIPPGGNWKHVPSFIPSKRLEQIRRSGGRTTYYGRLRWDAPAYTISTYFHRPGNGAYIHPSQDRLISFREAARLQSFPDSYRFFGPKSSLLKQIGNAVPPLLAEGIARLLPGETVADIFAGAGGFSLGFALAGYEPIAALEIDKWAAHTFKANHPQAHVVVGDATQKEVLEEFIDTIWQKVGSRGLDVLIGGPPCQGFSTAGWRKANDPRNMLWKSYIDAVTLLMPKWFVMENVPGFLSTPVVNDATGEPTDLLVIDLLREEFRSLGYKTFSFVLSAEGFGVPQKRRRFFLVGVKGGGASLAHVVLPPKPRLGRSITVYEAIGNLPPLGVNDGEEETCLDELTAEGPYQAWSQGELELEKMFHLLTRDNLVPLQPSLF